MAELELQESAPDTTTASPVASPQVDPAGVATQSVTQTDWRKDYIENAKKAVKDPTTFDEKKILSRLERYQSPNSALDTLIQLQERISRGEMRSVLPKDAKPETVAKWRADNGLPAAPEDYRAELGEGTVLGEADQAMINGFKKLAYEKNMAPEQFQAALGYYYDVIEQNAAKQEEADNKIRQTAEDHFRQQWGPDYRKNRAIIDAFLSSGPEGLKEMIFNARAADGTPLGSHIGVLSFLADRAREVIDATTILPGDAAAMGKSVTDELNSIRALMGDKASDYWKGPKAEAMQARYRDLVTANEKLMARGK